MQTHRPLNAAAQAALNQAVERVSQLPGRLFTPTVWAERALVQGLELAGSQDGAEKTAECMRYLACQEALTRLAERCAELEQALVDAGQPIPGPLP